jgi:hypothetical protein
MTQTDWLNIFDCAVARRQNEGMTVSPDVNRSRWLELITAETAILNLMVQSATR